MWFDICQRDARHACQSYQGAKLIDALFNNLLFRACQFTATERLAIVERRMRPDLDAMPCRQDERGVSRGRVTGMEAAGHIRRRDEWHQLGVEQTAFTEVAVEVNLHQVPFHSARIR